MRFCLLNCLLLYVFVPFHVRFVHGVDACRRVPSNFFRLFDFRTCLRAVNLIYSLVLLTIIMHNRKITASRPGARETGAKTRVNESI